MPLVLLGGIVSRENVDRAMAEGFDFVAMGRALIADPDLVQPDAQRPARALALHPLQRLRRRDGPQRRALRAGRRASGAGRAAAQPWSCWKRSTASRYCSTSVTITSRTGRTSFIRPTT